MKPQKKSRFSQLLSLNCSCITFFIYDIILSIMVNEARAL
jgi:hypothetical protein